MFEFVETMVSHPSGALPARPTVYVLPDPNIVRSADFIFVRKGVYKLYDLKTISGKSSADNRLIESIGQANRVLLNITTSSL